MEWLKAFYEVLGSDYPRLSLGIAALIGATLFGGGWWVIGQQYEKQRRAITSTSKQETVAKLSQPVVETSPALTPLQERLLELLAGYQKQFGAGKLVVLRNNGGLHFDNEPEKGAGISLLRDLYGSQDAANAIRFEQLMESMPMHYIRTFPEMRLDSPFVVSVSDKGMEYLRSRR